VVRIRRRRVLILRAGDEMTIDIAGLLQGELALRKAPNVSLLCPIRGQPIPLNLEELAVVMSVPADQWITIEEVSSSPPRC